MSAKEKTTADTFKPSDDALTERVLRARAEGRKLRQDGDGWLVDAKTGEPVGPDPMIERPLSKARLDQATLRHGDRIIRRGRPPKANKKQLTTLRLDPDLLEQARNLGAGWQTRINDLLRVALLKQKKAHAPRKARAKISTVIAGRARKVAKSKRGP